MKPITREELEKERVEIKNPTNIYCTFSDTLSYPSCTRAGDYMRCFLDSSVNCPFYRTYLAQRDIFDKRRLDAEG